MSKDWPANIDYPECAERDCNRPGIVQVRLRDGHSAPYCSDHARPLVLSRQVAAIGPPTPKAKADVK